MPSGSHSETFQVGNTVFNRTKNKTADSANAYGDAASPITMAAGKTVTSWVKTDADTAACVLPSGHGYSSGKFDVYDSAGVCYRYGVDGTVVGDALSLDGGHIPAVPAGGAGFPSSATVGVVVCKQQQVNATIDGDLAVLVGFEATVIGHADLQDGSSATVREFNLAANDADCWDEDKAVNPYTGNVIVKVLVSNGTTADGVLRVAVLQDSTP